jgi:two-component system LytT family response regulator
MNNKLIKTINEIQLSIAYESKRISLPTNDGIWVIKLKDIIRIEADGNYSKFFFTNEAPLLMAKNLKEFESLLADYKFERIHKSHLINLHYVKRYYKTNKAYLLLNDETKINVSRAMHKKIIESLQLL